MYNKLCARMKMFTQNSLESRKHLPNGDFYLALLPFDGFKDEQRGALT